MEHSELEKLLVNSIWIAQYGTLLAYQTINNISIPTSNQIIWIIDSYKNGYVFGTSYTAIDKNSVLKTKIFGFIIPNRSRNIQFSFRSDNNYIMYGSGELKKNDYGWQFLMQLYDTDNTSRGMNGPNQWLCMKPITTHDREYYYLPIINISVPELIALFC